MIYTNNYKSPLGNILLAGDKQGLTGLWFTEGSRYTGLGLKKDARRCETDYFDQTKEWLDIYFSGRDPGFFPRLHLVGSDFRNRVGEIMCEMVSHSHCWASRLVLKPRFWVCFGFPVQSV